MRPISWVMLYLLLPAVASLHTAAHCKTIWKHCRALQQLASPLSSSCLISMLLRDLPIHKRAAMEWARHLGGDKTFPRSAFTTAAGTRNGGNRMQAFPLAAVAQL